MSSSTSEPPAKYTYAPKETVDSTLTALGLFPDKVRDVGRKVDALIEAHTSPTLFNAGSPQPQMSSCFLIDMKDDSIEGIYDTLKTCQIPSVIQTLRKGPRVYAEGFLCHCSQRMRWLSKICEYWPLRRLANAYCSSETFITIESENNCKPDNRHESASNAILLFFAITSPPRHSGRSSKALLDAFRGNFDGATAF